MKKLSLVLIAATVLVAYQNCAKQGFEGISGEASLNLDSQIQDISLPDESAGTEGASAGFGQKEVGVIIAKDIRFIETPETALGSDLSKIGTPAVASRDGGSKPQANYTQVRLIADLVANQLNIIDYKNNLIKKYCLPRDVIASLQASINNAKLCQTIVPQGQICTQVMQSAHTFLHHLDGATTYKLGESRNGCGAGKIEFCGETAANFKNLWEHLKSQREKYACEETQI